MYDECHEQDHSGLSEQQTPDASVFKQAEEETPWSPPADPNSHKHELCKSMVTAFSEGEYESAQVKARLLLIQSPSTFRVYAHLILAYGIDHGLSHARKAELAIKTHEDNHDQVAKLFGLAQRTLALIESQEPAMEQIREAEKSDGVEKMKQLITEQKEKAERGQEQTRSQESVQAACAAWNFKSHKRSGL